MRIVCIHYTSPPIIGGLEFACCDLASAAARHNGWRGIVISGTDSRSVSTEYAGVQFVFIPEISTKNPLNREIYEAVRLNKEYLQIDREIDSLAILLDPHILPGDLVVSFNILSVHYNPALSMALLRLSRERSDFIHIAWAFDINTNIPRLKDTHSYWSALWKYEKRIYYRGSSLPVKQAFAENLGVSCQRIGIIPAGFDIPRVSRMSRDMTNLWRRRLSKAFPLLFMPVRISRRKNISFALEMMHHLLTKYPYAHLVIAGALSVHDETVRLHMEDLLLMIESLCLQNSVSFLSQSLTDNNGNSFRDSMAAFEVADLALVTSSEEGFLIPILEAAFHRVPLCVPSLPSIVSWASDKAFLYPLSAKPAELAVWIGEKIEQNGQKMRHETLSEYSWDSVFKMHFAPLAVRAIR